MRTELVAAIIVCAGGMAACSREPVEAPVPGANADLTGKTVLMVIAPDRFRDEELATPAKMLREAGAQVNVASTTLDEITGMLGARVRADVLLKDARAERFDAIVFVGGGGAQALFDDHDAHRLAREGAEQKKVVAAICIAPCILANAGILKGRTATVWPGREFVQILEKGGAKVSSDPVATDGLLITGNGPDAAAEFGKALLLALQRPPG